MITPEIFLEWPRYAIGRVGPGYFGFVERVYCYELYHFLRVAMYGYECSHGPIQNVYLHSEFVKVAISDEEARRFGVYPLGNRRSPDFILHEPNTTDHQIAAMEVKTNPDLSYADFVADIEKLSELRSSYRYGLVIFHCINVDLGRILQHITRSQDEWIVLDPEVLIIAKPDSHLPIQEVYLGELL
ncbi:hypothetical protein [Pseudoalteromonas sp. OOF1S-7]|uniref:hypothetical protein n=1 Tax=Pseudoalteromonas sp. OOF1S-7 TaxID=2917757 RepID=UPI001EF42C03|nr:hypothetical protein [Pseudoalteromonas sp. OOF1S-7]MCG7536011.1 hypothetical protein [Pseudoalteromonas sp. OOF1S-7]